MATSPCIVAVGAHAADMEFSAGAALLKHAREGWDVHIVNLTLGEKGHGSLSPEDYGAQKRREAQEAAELLGATPRFLPYLDGEVPMADAAAREIAMIFRELQPQVIVTHWRESIHLDHTHTHHLVRRARFMAAIRHFDLEGLPPLRGARLYYADNWEDPEAFDPYVFVDVSDVVPDWEKAFKRFAIGRGEGGYPYWDWYEARTRLHGIARGVGHAMAFAVDPFGKCAVRPLL